MSKTYILQKDIESPMGCIAAGTESIFDGGFYCFPYISRKYNDDKNGWLGNAFMCSQPEAWPEWFVLKPDGNIGKQIDIQNAISILHHEGYKIISPEENKSNDSFQWTDELVELYMEEEYGMGYSVGKTISHFKKKHTSKPQAENRPDLYTMRWKEEDYLLDKNATVTGKPAFLMSEKGLCTKSWVAELNTTTHWMCDPIGIVASSNKLLGLPSIEEYAEQAENKPDWEITKYEFQPLSKKGHPFWIDKTSTHWENAKTNKDYKVFEVKRVIDEEFFVVGEVTDGGNKIHAFELLGGHLRVHMKSVSNPGQGWLTNIASLVKKKQAQPDWEIVEFRNPYNYPIIDDGTGNWYIPQIKSPQTTCSYEDVLEAAIGGMNKIHSVKRLSDNTVFSVGDELCGLGYYQNETHKIKSIYPKNGTICFEYGEGGGIIIQAAKKLPPQPQKDAEQMSSSDYFKTFWGKPQEQRIEVRIIPYWSGENIVRIGVEKDGGFEEKVFLQIKQAIEQVLNEKKVDRLAKWEGNSYYTITGEKLHTQQQVDAMCEDAFNAAREKEILPQKVINVPTGFNADKYVNYEHYKLTTRWPEEK